MSLIINIAAAVAVSVGVYWLIKNIPTREYIVELDNHELLEKAIHKKDIDTIEYLIKKGAGYYEYTWGRGLYERTKDNADILRSVIEKLVSDGHDDLSCFYLAVTYKLYDIVEHLMKVDSSLMFSAGIVMEAAIEHGDTDIVKTIIDSGYNVRDSRFDLLHAAVTLPTVDMLQMLVNAGGILNDRHMISAVQQDNVTIIKWILKQGIKLEDRELMLLVAICETDIQRIFVEHGWWHDICNPYDFINQLDHRHIQYLSAYPDVIRIIRNRDRKWDWGHDTVIVCR